MERGFERQGMFEVTLPELYPHQEDVRDRTRAALAKYGRVILCGNPGFGKTRIAKWILGAASNRVPNDNQSGHALFAVQKRGLVDNASDSFSEEPELGHGIIMSGSKTAWGHRVQVASIDTLVSWFVRNGEYDTTVTFDLIIYDECHSHHPKLKKFLTFHDAARKKAKLHHAFLIGLSATPQAKGLAEVYNDIVKGPNTEWLIENNFLSPYRYFQATQGNLSLLKKSSTGNFTAKSEAKAMDGLAGDLVRDWKKYGQGRPTVGFFPLRSHAQDARDQLENAGVKVAYIDGETPDDVRKRIFWELSNEKVEYLCNVQVVERGTDIPAIGCVQLCVAIGSITRYRQMIGRGSRVAPGKTDVVIIDHGGNVTRHGFFEDDPDWILDQTDGLAVSTGERLSLECPQCNAIYRGGRCSNCGYEPTKKELRSKGLEFDGQDLREIKPTEKKKKLVGAEDLFVQTLYRAGRSGKTWRQCVGIFYGAAKKQGGPKYRVPKTVTVGGNKYETVRIGSEDGNRKVKNLYPFTDGGGHGGKYHLGQS